MRIEVEVRGQRQEIKNAVYSAQQSENCLECAFDFITPEWQGLVKTAHFRAEPDGEVFCAVLQEDQCLVPSKVLEKDGYFSFSVIGEKENYRITTAALSVLNRKAVYGGEPQEEPEETQYEQMISLAASAVSTAKQAQETANAVKADAESGKFKGEKGDPGETGAQGAKGENGMDGAAATVTVGTVATAVPGTQASVINSGTENAAVLDFVLPKGEKGEKGDPGNSSITEIEPGTSQTQPYVLNSISGIYRCKKQGWVQVLPSNVVTESVEYQQPFFVGSNALILLGSTADAGKPGAGGTFITVLDDSFRIALKPVQGDTQTVDLTFETLQELMLLLQIISHFAGAIQNCDPGDIVTVLDQDTETGLYNLISKQADSALSDSSTFAVQNKVVTAALAQKKAIPEISTPSGSSITLENNSEYRLQATASLNLALPESIPDDYECSLVFESGEAATVLSYPSDTIEFFGDDCDAEGDFIPIANTGYEINIKNLGFNRIIARVGAF